MSSGRTLLALAVGLIALAVPSAASATVTNAQFGFCTTNCLDTTTTGKAGANVSYHFQFNVPAGFDGGAPQYRRRQPPDRPRRLRREGARHRLPRECQPLPNRARHRRLQRPPVPKRFDSGDERGRAGRDHPVQRQPQRGTGRLARGRYPQRRPGTAAPWAAASFFSIATSLDGSANTNNFSLVAGDPAQLDPESGENQFTTVGTAFGSPLQAHLTDSCGNDVPNTNVSFTTPGTGASGSFAAGTSTTNASGIATSTALAANTVAGDWQAGASVTGGSNPSTAFGLINNPGEVDSVALGLQPTSIFADGFSTSTATLHLEDEFDNPVTGLNPSLVTFSSADTGHVISSTDDIGSGDYSAEITASTTPGDSVITGTYDGTLQDTGDAHANGGQHRPGLDHQHRAREEDPGPHADLLLLRRRRARRPRVQAGLRPLQGVRLAAHHLEAELRQAQAQREGP